MFFFTCYQDVKLRNVCDLDVCAMLDQEKHIYKNIKYVH